MGVIGYGEGGLLALHAAAADTRVDAAAVCGYFGPREQIWQEPIYRNLFGVLEEFGDAELAALVAPRTLVVEACRHPQVDGPPPRGPRRIGGAAGRLRTPPPAAVAAEFERARELISQLAPAPHLELVGRGNGPPGSDMLLGQFLRGLKMKRKLLPSGRRPKRSGAAIDGLARLRRQFEQLVNHTQRLLDESAFRRKEFWIRGSKARKEAASKKVMCRDDYLLGTAPKGTRPTGKTWERYAAWYRKYYWEQIIGLLPKTRMPLNPRTRLFQKRPKYTAYEVVLPARRFPLPQRGELSH